MHNLVIDALPQSRRERMAYIDFRLCFLGRVARADICNRFGVAPAVATRDLALYRSIAPDNLAIEQQSRQYVTAAGFYPVFEHALDRVLVALSCGFGELEQGPVAPLIASDLPRPISCPDMDVLSCVSRAIHLGHALDITYHSNSSGYGRREIVPGALVDNGLRWHVRAYDRSHDGFRDFVLTRVESPKISLQPPAAGEQLDQDAQWTRLVDLELIPHPGCRQPAVIERDFSMLDGVLRMRVRAANAGYVLRRWNVDCSAGHALSAHEHLLALRNPLSLYGVTSAVLAPGFTPVE